MDNYEPLEKIGSGSFGIIRKVRRKADGKILARKEINYAKMSEKEKLQLVSEVNILRELRHPNIVRYYERYVDKEQSRIYIVMEYCEGGDLGSVIRKYRNMNIANASANQGNGSTPPVPQFIEEETVWRIFTQISLALHECHNFKHGIILHRDLKPENIFLDAGGNVKLGDFGLSRVLGHQRDFAKTFVGTPYYMSPEQVNESGYDVKSDIWSLGCLLYELCALCPPFDGPNQAVLSTRIRQGQFRRLPSCYSDDLNRVVSYLLQTDATKRPGTLDVFGIPQVKFYVKERNLQLRLNTLKRREEEVAKREREIASKENEIKAKLKFLEERETLLSQKEALFSEQQQQEQRKWRKAENREIMMEPPCVKSSPSIYYSVTSGSNENSPIRDKVAYANNILTTAASIIDYNDSPQRIRRAIIMEKDEKLLTQSPSSRTPSRRQVSNLIFGSNNRLSASPTSSPTASYSTERQRNNNNSCNQKLNNLYYVERSPSSGGNLKILNDSGHGSTESSSATTSGSSTNYPNCTTNANAKENAAVSPSASSRTVYNEILLKMEKENMQSYGHQQPTSAFEDLKREFNAIKIKIENEDEEQLRKHLNSNLNTNVNNANVNTNVNANSNNNVNNGNLPFSDQTNRMHLLSRNNNNKNITTTNSSQPNSRTTYRKPIIN